MSKSKKRILAGIMSLLLIITSVFTGNVVTAKAASATEISYDEFNPDKTNNLYMIELKNCNVSCGSVSFDTTPEDSKVNPEDGDMSKSRFQGSSVTISFTPIEGEYVDRILIGTTEYRPGDENFEKPTKMEITGEVFTYTTQESDFDEYGYLYIEVGFTGGGSGVTSYGKDGILEFNIENPDQGDVFFQIGGVEKYRVGGDNNYSEDAIQDALKDTTLQANSTIKVWAEAYGGKIVGNFDIRIDGASVFTTDEERTAARTAAENTEGYTFTVPQGYESTKRIEFAIEFRDETPGGSNSALSYGKDGILEFNIENPDQGDVFFQIGGVEKYRVGGDNNYSEDAIQDALKDTTLQANSTIKVWAEAYGGKIVGNFDIRIDGASVFTTDEERTAARTAAESTEGYTFTVPAGYESTKRIEFAIEFRDETPSGGGNDVTYTEDATISEDTTKNDITVSAGTLTIGNCSVRVDHELVVESSANIVGTSASSKLVFAGHAFSNGIELYYGDEKISDDNNNYFSNNGDGPIEFNWDTASTRWVTEQQPAEGGGEAPWYTVSYGNSANLTTENGQVYAERVHIGDITYSSIASEYNASESDEIYSMEDTIFHQKTEEEENNPESGYEDPLMKYGIGGSDGDIFIRSDVSGVSIDFKFIPNFGYQLTNIYTNENETDSLLNEFTAAEAVSSFKFDVKQGGNVHFEVKFEKVDNKVTGNAGIASAAKVESTNAAASGTLEMKVDNATASNAIPSGSEALAAYDITLANVVSKGGDRGSWDTLLEDLGTNVATVTLPVEDTTNYTYTVIREHKGENPVTLDVTVTDGAISFDTNKFSKYTIVSTPYTAPTNNGGNPSGGTTTDNTTTETKPDGTKVETSTETKTDGTKVETTVETKTDGTKTETVVETAKDGSVKTTETVTNADGSSTKTQKETETNAKGKEVEVTTVTQKDTQGNVAGITETSVIENIVGKADATVTVEKSATGEITSAQAEVNKNGSKSKSGVKGTLNGSVVSQIAEAAGTKSVEISMTVTAGEKEYTVKADAGDITVGNKLKVMAIDPETGNYILVNAKTYTVSKAGSVSVTLPAGATYQLLDSKEAAAVEKKILATVKVKKTSTTVEKGKKTSVQMSSKLDMDNVESITYSTSKKSVATVSKSGKVTAKNSGTVTITVTVILKNGKTKTVKMKINVK